jgi:diaminobutyrate-2-oxoglutarate transaminase
VAAIPSAPGRPDHPCVDDLRGRGLMIDVSSTRPPKPTTAPPAPPPRSSPPPSVGRFSPAVRSSNSAAVAPVVRLLPPLTIDDQAEALLDRLADSLTAAERSAPGGTA